MNSKIIYITEGIDVIDKIYGISEEERAVIIEHAKRIKSKNLQSSHCLANSLNPP